MNKIFEVLAIDYKKNKLFFLVFILPVCLLPAFLISGPFLSDLTVTICTIYTTYMIFVKKKNHLINYKIFYFIVIFWLYILICSFFSYDIYLSLTETLFYFRFIFFCIFIFFLLDTYKNFINYFTIIFLITFIFLFLDSYFQYFLGFNVIGNVYNGYRLNSFFGDELKLGSFISRLLPLLVGLLIYISSKYKYSILIVIFVILNSFIIIILTGERIAFFIFIIFILGCFILMKFNFLYKLFSLLLFTITCILIVSMNSYVYERMYLTTKNQLLNSNNLDYIFLSRSHHNTFITAYNMFIENPIKGVGVKNFSKSFYVMKINIGISLMKLSFKKMDLSWQMIMVVSHTLIIITCSY